MLTERYTKVEVMLLSAKEKYYANEVFTNCRGRLCFQKMELGDEMRSAELCLGIWGPEATLVSRTTSFHGEET